MRLTGKIYRKKKEKKKKKKNNIKKIFWNKFKIIKMPKKKPI
jgi:hypothetical protein